MLVLLSLSESFLKPTQPKTASLLTYISRVKKNLGVAMMVEKFHGDSKGTAPISI